MNDNRYLRETACEVTQARKLPNRAPDRMWGGPGTGATCVVCGASTMHAEVELELEFAYDDRPGRDSYLVHLRCYTPSTGAAAPVARLGHPHGSSS